MSTFIILNWIRRGLFFSVWMDYIYKLASKWIACEITCWWKMNGGWKIDKNSSGSIPLIAWQSFVRLYIIFLFNCCKFPIPQQAEEKWRVGGGGGGGGNLWYRTLPKPRVTEHVKWWRAVGQATGYSKSYKFNSEPPFGQIMERMGDWEHWARFSGHLPGWHCADPRWLIKSGPGWHLLTSQPRGGGVGVWGCVVVRLCHHGHTGSCVPLYRTRPSHCTHCQRHAIGDSVHSVALYKINLI